MIKETVARNYRLKDTDRTARGEGRQHSEKGERDKPETGKLKELKEWSLAGHPCLPPSSGKCCRIKDKLGAGVPSVQHPQSAPIACTRWASPNISSFDLQGRLPWNRHSLTLRNGLPPSWWSQGTAGMVLVT